MEENLFIPFSIKQMKQGINVDEYLSVRLIDMDDDINKIANQYKIYVCIDGKPLSICKSIPIKIENHYYNDMDELLKSSTYTSNELIDPYTDFWVTLSTMQSWVDNNYNLTVMHSVLVRQILEGLIKNGHFYFVNPYLTEMEKYFILENDEWIKRFITIWIQDGCNNNIGSFLIIQMLKFYDEERCNLIIKHLIELDDTKLLFYELFDLQYIKEQLNPSNERFDFSNPFSRKGILTFYGHLITHYAELFFQGKKPFHLIIFRSNIINYLDFIPIKESPLFALYKNLSISQLNMLVEGKFPLDININNIFYFEKNKNIYITNSIRTDTFESNDDSKIFKLKKLYF